MHNQHFSSLFDQYNVVDHEVNRIETGVETTSDDYLGDQKKLRSQLEDELFKMIIS